MHLGLLLGVLVAHPVVFVMFGIAIAIVFGFEATWLPSNTSAVDFLRTDFLRLQWRRGNPMRGRQQTLRRTGDLMHIVCQLDYSSDEVVTFDPEKVVTKLRAAFPDADVDTTDQSAAEIDRVREFVAYQTETTPELQAAMLRQIQGKARRNGPIYCFTLPGILGVAGRYSVYFMSDTDIDSIMQQRIVTFLHSLRLGTVEVR